MKLRQNLHKLALSSVALGAIFCASATAADGWYVGLGAGLSLPNDVAVPGSIAIGNNLLRGATIQRDNGLRGVATAGYGWQQHLRLEGEIGYSDPAINVISVGGVSAAVSGADISELTLFGNVLYDLPVAEDFALTLGGGLGLGMARLDTGTAKSNDSGFAFQTITGISYHWSEKLDLAFDYRYVRTSGLHYGGGSSDFGSHNLMLSLRWFIDRGTPAAPAPVTVAKVVAPAPPPPPPAPASPPPVKTYIVFFDFNKSYLTDAAQSVVAEAIRVAKTTGMVKVQIAGHTDTVGSNEYNMKLSLARAATVKDEMVRLGMDGSAISVEGKGFHDPLVATAPNVREPQNRRAVIDLGS
jgi:outer membrane protein OmpA-like peptidoglycan-associated protein/opacity protein-like surface antigen